MSDQDYSTDSSSDTDYEYSSDSGYSADGSVSSVDPVSSQVVSVGIFLPIFQLVPIHCATLYPSIPADSFHQQVSGSATSNHRLIKWSLPPPPVSPVSLPGWKPMPYGLERFWQSAFAWFFRPFLAEHGHLWTLEPTELPPLSVEWPWHTITHLAKVRFQCQCKRGWTSMKGRVAFWFRVRRQGDQILCEALLKLFGQQCNFCNQPQSYESDFLTPLWYPDQIENAVSFFASQVANSYYGHGRHSIADRLSSDRLRHSQPRKNSSLIYHDSIRCQACKDGCCVSSGYFA